jgi:hypothetical protein
MEFFGLFVTICGAATLAASVVRFAERLDGGRNV